MSSNNGLQAQLPKLNGRNYHQRSIQMRVLYESQDPWQIVEKDIQSQQIYHQYHHNNKLI